MILAAGISRGLSIDATEHMTLGMWVDYIIEWNDLHSDKDREVDSKGETVHKRAASQGDFDSF